ncbi:MAG: DegT/DnrJ/EryC1/StrS family aminotransferase [Gaiellales bacterium]|nr:MAG: DegT/DnrJ/EryC1/StrS family aminotransferase [Gaiellales bacterium]
MEANAKKAENRQIPFLDLDALHEPLSEELEAAYRDVVSSGSFILGANVAALEEEIAAYCGTGHAVGVASGTDAIHLALRAYGVGPGDDVITSPFTFCATADSIMLAGARPLFADIDPHTFNIDPGAVESALTGRTRAVIAVNLYGQAADLQRLRALADRHDFLLIEDNAQALGATLGGKRTGSLGDAGAISFFPSKNLGCFGDGGMVITDDEAAAARLRSLRVHGAARKYYSEELGLNSRLDELQAAFLRVKLPHLDSWNLKRRENACLYDSLLAGHEGIVTPAVSDGSEHVYHQYTVRVRERERVREELAAAGVATAVYYPVPLHRQPLFDSALVPDAGLSEAEKATGEVLSLPIGPELSETQVERVAASLIEAVSR